MHEAWLSYAAIANGSGGFAPGVLPDTPLVELTDERRVLVENHGGITEFEPELIRVRVRFGTLAVHGRCLCIAKMSAKQLVITGRIDGVTLERKGAAK